MSPKRPSRRFLLPVLRCAAVTFYFVHYFGKLCVSSAEGDTGVAWRSHIAPERPFPPSVPPDAVAPITCSAQFQSIPGTKSTKHRDAAAGSSRVAVKPHVTFVRTSDDAAERAYIVDSCFGKKHKRQKKLLAQFGITLDVRATQAGSGGQAAVAGVRVTGADGVKVSAR